MPLMIGLLAGLLAVVVGYELKPLRRSAAEVQLRDLSGVQEEEIPLAQALMIPVADVLRKVLPGATIRDLDRRLYWAQFQGKWRGWTGAMALALIVCLSGAGLAVGIVTGKLLLGLLLAFVGGLFPFSRLQGATERLLRRVHKGLPDLAERLALEVTGGSTVQSALRTVAENYPGLLGEFLRRAERESQASGQAVLSILRARAEDTGLREMVSLFVKLEDIERQGVDAARRLTGVAEDTRRDYLSVAEARVEALGGKVMIPIIAFYLVPYLLLALAPLAVNILTLLRGGG
jgi:Flp pilus assembly protein TadB